MKRDGIVKEVRARGPEAVERKQTKTPKAKKGREAPETEEGKGVALRCWQDDPFRRRSDLLITGMRGVCTCPFL